MGKSQKGWTYEEMYLKIQDYKNLPDVENSKNLVISLNDFVRILEEKFEGLKNLQRDSKYLENLAEEIAFDKKSYEVISARKSLLSQKGKNKLLLLKLKQLIKEGIRNLNFKRLICNNITCGITNHDKSLEIKIYKTDPRNKQYKTLGKCITLVRDIGSKDIYFELAEDEALITYNLDTITYLFDLMEEYLKFFNDYDIFMFTEYNFSKNICKISDGFFDIKVIIYSNGNIETDLSINSKIDPTDIYSKQFVTKENLSKIVSENLSEIGNKILVDVNSLEEPFKTLVIEAKTKEYKLEKKI